MGATGTVNSVVHWAQIRGISRRACRSGHRFSIHPSTHLHVFRQSAETGSFCETQKCGRL